MRVQSATWTVKTAPGRGLGRTLSTSRCLSTAPRVSWRSRDLQPKLWIHGHTHDRCDYAIGNTRVVANPLGYPTEIGSQKAFEPAFQVEV